jgi:transcriptional regulator with XRE-family HTH domain
LFLFSEGSMPNINPEILRWARETAGLSLGRAAATIGMKDNRKGRAVDRLAALEDGDEPPSRALLAKMAEKYHRPLVAFYLDAPPVKGDRGEDFRSIPDKQTGSEALVDALLRDVRARQDAIRDLLLEDEDTKPLRFVGSMKASDGADAVLASIADTLELELADYRDRSSPEQAFALLRAQAEAWRSRAAFSSFCIFNRSSGVMAGFSRFGGGSKMLVFGGAA